MKKHMRTTQSFTQKVKDELCQNQYDSKERLRALLSAYIRINGSVIFQQKQSLLSLETENAKIAKFIYQSINQLYEADAHLTFYKNQRRKNNLCHYDKRKNPSRLSKT